MCKQVWELKHKELSWRAAPYLLWKALNSVYVKNICFRSQLPGQAQSYSAIISLGEYQYANISSVRIQNALHAYKQTQGVHVCRFSKSIKHGNKYLNEIQSRIHPAVNMIKFTTEPETLLVETAGSSHSSSASVAYCAMNHSFCNCFWIIYEFLCGLSLGKCNRALHCMQF